MRQYGPHGFLVYEENLQPCLPSKNPAETKFESLYFEQHRKISQEIFLPAYLAKIVSK